MAKDKSSAAESAKKAKSSEKKKPGRISKFFKDLRSEFNKIVWPSRQQTINNTLVVLVTMVVIGLFIGGVDLGLGKLLKLLVDYSS